MNRVVEWIAGLPEIGWSGSVKTRDKVRFRVEVFRCKDCGYLEQYASKPLPKAGFFDMYG
ncbi:MAG TPA: hypothetical protein VI685_06135 [Candidatus Angelobacter sp.]